MTNTFDIENFSAHFEKSKTALPLVRFDILLPFITEIMTSVKRSIFPGVQDFDWDDINSDFMLKFYTICWHDSYFDYDPRQFYKFTKEMAINCAKAFVLEENKRNYEHINIDDAYIIDNPLDVENRIDHEKAEIEEHLTDVFNCLIGGRNLNEKFKKAIERYSRIVAEKRISEVY